MRKSRLQNPSSPYIDLVSSYLRSQIVTLHKVLEQIERTHSYEEDYVIMAIREAEQELRRLRKFIDV